MNMNTNIFNLFAAFSLLNINRNINNNVLIYDNKPNKEIFGVSSIKKGDKFYGYSCGVLFENQICTDIDKDGNIYGTTTLAIFKKENISLY